jgi:hypothetical protein
MILFPRLSEDQKFNRVNEPKDPARVYTSRAKRIPLGLQGYTLSISTANGNHLGHLYTLNGQGKPPQL